MKKRILQKLVPTFLLLLLTLTAFGVMPLTQAETTDTYSLTVHYGTGCETVQISVDGGTPETLTSGTPYPIPKTNTKITITVMPKNGYEVKSMVGQSGETYLLKDNVYTAAFTADDVVTLTCQPKQYRIEYLAADEGYHRQPPEGTFPTTYTFGDEGTKISTPILDGYKFKYWILLASENAEESTGTILSPKEGEDFVTLSSTTLPNTDTEILYLKPKWEPNKYVVTRYDCIYDPDKPDHIGSLLENGVVDLSEPLPMHSQITGDMGGEKNYAGFYYVSDPKYYTTATVTVRDESNWSQVNIVYRLYLPIEYALEYASGYDGEIAFAEGAVVPQKHVYNAATNIPVPVRTGYEFVSWTVTVTKNGTPTTLTNTTGQIGIMDADYAGDKDTKIVLTANWKACEYNVLVDENKGTDGDTRTETYVYDKGLTVADPVRPGYSFKGWLINGGTELQSGELPAFTYTADITMVAQWEANEYTVTLDGNGAQDAGTQSLKVVFDTALNTDGLTLPVKEGHQFLGFTLTKDGDDYVIDADGKFLRSVWDIPNDTTLYARWDVIPYLVTVNVTNAQVWLNDILYEGTPISFDYGTKITVKVVAANGFKVTAWEGAAVEHQKEFITEFTLGAADTELDITVLGVISAPAFLVDYINEVFYVENGIPDGTYQIKCGSETLKIKVAGGKITVNDVEVTQVNIPESFFGKTVEIVTFGDGVNTANSDADVKTLAARPEQPNLNNHIDGIYADTTSIVVKLNPNSPFTYGYEFALYLDKEGKQLVVGWTSAAALADGAKGITFENLNPGTYYYVFARIQASEGNYPHGEVNIFQQNTYFEDYLNQEIAKLEALKENGGEMVKKLIDEAIAEAKALTKPSATFYHDLEVIVNRVNTVLPFAQVQDEKIAALRKLYTDLIATDEFSPDGEALLTERYEIGVEAIKTATDTADAQAAFETASAALKAVPISYLTYDPLYLTALSGLSQGTKLFGTRLDAIASLAEAVDTAIQTGRVFPAVGCTLSQLEVEEMLKSLDVMAAYNMRLTYESATVTSFNGMFEVRLLLPEDMQGETGLQVAYYNEKTGDLEVLETQRDGNYLIFTANAVKDFVILGDPTVNLTGLIAALGVTLLCQLIAIVFLLVRRSKYAKEHRSYSLMLPILLTIRFLPDHAMTAVLVLGGLVILFQIVLMYLLLSSEMFYSRKRRNPTPQPQEERNEPEALSVMADASEEDLAADTEETFEESYEEIDGDVQDDSDLISYAAVDAIFDEDAETTEEGLEDVEALYGDNEESDVEELDEEATGEDALDGDDPYGFIEPAANPRYSLPEEDFAAYDGDADDADEAEVLDEEQATETLWAYDDTEAEASDENGAYEHEEVDETAMEEVPEFEQLDMFDEAANDASLYEQEPDEDATDADREVALTEGEEEATDGDSSSDTAAEDEESDQADEAEAEETVEQDEFYIEPDARGDEAPAPEYLEDFEDGESSKQYDGYEE